jgi:hypothetical protein
MSRGWESAGQETNRKDQSMRRLLLAGALLVALLVPTSSALATVHSPTGEFANFKYCPTGNPEVNYCLYSETTSGFLTIGKKTTPIVKPQILQAGLKADLSTFQFTVYGAETGNTLPKTPQPVPGGLLGVTAPSWWPSLLRNLFNETINNGFTGVQATMELAGPASAIKFSLFGAITGEEPALSMPVKVKLSNPFLGSNCYIGSNSQPITLNLTTGTTAPPPPNTPISGSPGKVVENPQNTLATINGQKLVDNSFAVPGANGCGGLFSFLVDPFVESIVGIPSPAGKNTAVLEGKVQLAKKEAVIASE